MAIHTSERNGDVSAGRFLEVMGRGRLSEAGNGPSERIAVPCVLGILEDRPPRVAGQALELPTVILERHPIAGDDGLENLLRLEELFAHDAVERRPLTRCAALTRSGGKTSHGTNGR